MMISEDFPESVGKAAGGETRRAPAGPENWRDNTRDMSWARLEMADWWPLFVAGIVIALLL